MSVFGSIMGAIFGHGSAQASASPTAAPSAPAQTVAARKQLAAELKYTGNTNDSATMNVWLHKQI
ncbi:MAG: DUF3597 family protein, partial [Hyphomicrobiales bacterium]